MKETNRSLKQRMAEEEEAYLEWVIKGDFSEEVTLNLISEGWEGTLRSLSGRKNSQCKDCDHELLGNLKHSLVQLPSQMVKWSSSYHLHALGDGELTASRNCPPHPLLRALIGQSYFSYEPHNIR